MQSTPGKHGRTSYEPRARHHTTPVQYADIPQLYDRLLALHPLRPIHNDVELAQATVIIDMLAGRDLNVDQADYLDVLSTLVEAYENAHAPLDDPALCGLDVLRALLDEHGMSAADLARLLGVHRSMGSKLLEGRTYPHCPTSANAR